MGKHPNIDLYVRIVTAFNQGNLETVGAHLTDDVHYRRFGAACVSGTYKGAEAMVEHLRQLKAETGGTLLLTPEVVLGGDDAVTVYGHATTTRGDRKLDVHNAYVWRLRGGKSCEAMLISDDQQADAAFWA